ncbi:hypothetical protein, partial [Klebsiella michiganensis]|uniref:hypothetical protein n=1 Tax=Klebsiella michiganensis TaxID=1134687 RepID=UPI001954D86C
MAISTLDSTHLRRNPSLIKVNGSFDVRVPSADRPYYERLGLEFRGDRADETIYRARNEAQSYILK